MAKDEKHFIGGRFEKVQIPQWAVDKGAFKIEWQALKENNSDRIDPNIVIRDGKGLIAESFTQKDKDRLIEELGIGRQINRYD
jgi:hypothetical protein